MVCFQTKNSNFGKFWTVFKWKMWVFLWPRCLIYVQIYSHWSILCPNGIFYGHLVVIWYIFSRFGKLSREKSGNPASISGFAPSPTAQSIKVKKLAKTIRHPEGEFTS
jgi:hypothetical protein